MFPSIDFIFSSSILIFCWMKHLSRGLPLVGSFPLALEGFATLVLTYRGVVTKSPLAYLLPLPLLFWILVYCTLSGVSSRTCEDCLFAATTDLELNTFSLLLPFVDNPAFGSFLLTS